MTTAASRSPGAPGTAGAPYDEFWLAPDTPREHQTLLHEHLSQRKKEELEQIRHAVRRRITEQEVTFNILGVPEGTDRPWQLDSVPLVVDRAEWAELGHGLRQRARVINAVLDDCYGAQKLIKNGVLPAGLFYGHSHFLRACQGWQPIGGERLLLHCIDVGRGPDGHFRVYSDRPSGLTGAGYALENRLVLGRALADLFRGYRVERLSGFFQRVRTIIASLAPRQADEPRVVLMSAGRGDESAFEHAYLSRYLGYELVEGHDLTCRSDKVFLKTLTGLQPVDVILRRVPDALCDPLMLREDSFQGVAGLVAAARQGNVGLANPLGASFAEIPALKAYLPQACQFLFNQQLDLESVPTFWCGEEASLEHVLADPDAWSFKPAWDDRRQEPTRTALLDSKAKQEFLDHLRSRPADFIAEKWDELSVAPLWDDGKMRTGPMSVRTFLCRSGDDYEVMPGGLARADAAPDGIFLSVLANPASKDVWVPSVEEEQRLPQMPDKRLTLRRGGVDLPSRLLDDVYWLARYVERANMTARLVRAGLERMGLESDSDAPDARAALLRTLVKLDVIPGLAGSEPPPASEAGRGSPTEALFFAAAFDANRPGTLPAQLRNLHNLTLYVRSRLSRDAWHVLHRLSQWFGSVPVSAKEQNHVGDAINALDEVLVMLAAVSGTTMDNMVRGHVWLFLDMGRRVERGSLMLSMLQQMLPPGTTRVHMEALLEVADSLLTYRARYLSSLRVAPVVDLVLTDESNPRSVAFQVSALVEHVRKLPRPDAVVRSRAERRIVALHANLLTADIEQACGGDGSGLRELLEDSQRLLWQFSDDLSHTWFSHAHRERNLAAPVWIDQDLEAT